MCDMIIMHPICNALRWETLKIESRAYCIRIIFRAHSSMDHRIHCRSSNG